MNTQKIDWTQPLEAVHTDGRIIILPGLIEEPSRSWPLKAIMADGKHFYVSKERKEICRGHAGDGWTIRNVAPKEVEWGPEIKVEGKRPEWLGDDEVCDVFELGGWCGASGKTVAKKWFWPPVTAIRLPANHPHYTKPTRTALEQLDRMEALVRRMAHDDGLDNPVSSFQAEARAIVAELPGVVDPDLVLARSIVGNCANYMRNCLYGTQIVEGKHDDNDVVQFALKALRGRALERGESPVTNEGAGR